MSAPASSRQGPDFHVWLVEDNSLFRQGITAVIDGADGMDCGLAAGSCEEALSALDEQQPPDMVLMDIGLPGMSGIEGVARFRASCPETRIVMLTVHEEDDQVFAALCAGASVDQKYSNVVSSKRIIEYIEGLSADLFPDWAEAVVSCVV